MYNEIPDTIALNECLTHSVDAISSGEIVWMLSVRHIHRNTAHSDNGFIRRHVLDLNVRVLI